MDLYDSQWSSFRSSLPLLLQLAVAHTVLVNWARSKSASMTVWANLTVGLIYAFVLFGYKLVFLLTLLLINFGLTRIFTSTRLVVAVWVFNLSSLILVSSMGEDWVLFEFYSGMVTWANRYNMFLLKSISFGVDYAMRVSETIPIDSKPASLEYKSRMKTAHAQHEYSLVNYLGYMFYTPLMIAGPTMTYNAWWSQIKTPQTSLSVREIGIYAIRFLGIFLLMEVFLHFNYSNGIAAQKGEALSSIDSIGLGMWLSLCVLFFMWMKFLLIWRFFRLWSFGCGIETPENMNRCVFNNYSVAQFWKSWHSSFNIWIVRYIFIPLGGSKKNKFLNIFLVFLFVALWHDLDWRLLHWALIISLMFVPEMVSTQIYRHSKFFKSLRITHPLTCRNIATFAASLNILLLVVANLVGYVFGLDGLHVLSGVLAQNFSIVEFIIIAVTLFFGANIMRFLDWRKEHGAISVVE
jgi:protein-cysteine N-palmitoyltransferase HHAT